MEKKFIEFSLVTLANDHNPTLLNPDFLQRNQIVLDDWDWRVVGLPITTPAIATVQYDSKVAVTVEPTKLQVTDNSEAAISESHICELASNYLKVLPHVQYNALGVNFTTLTFVDDVNEFLISRFLKAGNWNSDKNQLQGTGYKFVYPMENGRIVFSVDVGTRQGNDKPFIVSKANFHRNLDPEIRPTSKQVINFLENIKADWERFEQLHTAIIES